MLIYLKSNKFIIICLLGICIVSNILTKIPVVLNNFFLWIEKLVNK